MPSRGLGNPTPERKGLQSRQWLGSCFIWVQSIDRQSAPGSGDLPAPPARAMDADPAVHKTLLESIHAIPGRIDWVTATFTCIGPQIEALPGQEPSNWKTVEDRAMHMHPDERAWAVDLCVVQSLACVDHDADYRHSPRTVAMRGSATWCMRCATNRGSVKALVLVDFMFDISERKKGKQKLLELQRALSGCRSRAA